MALGIDIGPFKIHPARVFDSTRLPQAVANLRVPAFVVDAQLKHFVDMNDAGLRHFGMNNSHLKDIRAGKYTLDYFIKKGAEKRLKNGDLSKVEYAQYIDRFQSFSVVNQWCKK
ncbi:MAG: hypothetical protein L3J28_07020 [Candidatus Polarisedimenticolaceae bacterium]|nr:hypothetical protein [Candidatus Polarisedimenticolaceae bacterium]